VRGARVRQFGSGGGGGDGSYLCTRHRRDATVSSAFLRTPRRVARGGGANPGIADSFLLSRARNRKTPYSNLCSRILPCGEAFSCYFSSLNSTGMYRSTGPCTHTSEEPRAGAAVVAWSQSASEAQLHNLRNPLRRPQRLRADGRRRREARSAFGAAGDELLGARAAAVAIAVRGVRGHSDHAVLDADRHRGRRPAHMWDAVFALGAVDAFCVLGSGCGAAEGESEVSRRAYWRAPRRERKRSHSTPPLRDDGGVERRQCRGAQQLASRLE
jgi:hypothetical protein